MFKRILFMLSITLCLILCGCGQNAADTSAGTSQDAPKGNVCTIRINCAAALNNPEPPPAGVLDFLPNDGMILKNTKATFTEGETAFDVLKRVTTSEKIHMDYSGTYIKGIGNLYEFDCGEKSGWQFLLNGEYPSQAASETVLKNGDDIEFAYTCDWEADM